MILAASIFSFLFIFFLALSVSKLIRAEEKEVRAKLIDRVKAGDVTLTPLQIERKRRLIHLPFLDQFLKRIAPLKRLQDCLSQAGLSIFIGSFILFSTLLGLLTFLFIVALGVHVGFAAPSALAAGVLPSLVVIWKRNRRRKKFSDRFPDAIDLMASSLRAGHSLQMAIQTVIGEGRDILSVEFEKVLSSIEVGQNFEGALKGILSHVDTPELRLFISAVVLQRETGGNLAELLDNLEGMIRDRQEMRRELSAATAQARFSGLILGLLPIFVAALVFMIQPDYVLFFFKDNLGRKLLEASVIGYVLGILTIQKIVHIEL